MTNKMAAAYRRSRQPAASEPYAEGIGEHAGRMPSGIGRASSKKSHIFPLEALDHTFVRFFLIVADSY